MQFSKFVYIVIGVLGVYYFLIILSDLLRNNNSALVGDAISKDREIVFDAPEKPEVITDEVFNPPISENQQRIVGNLQEERKEIENNELLDLGLETVSTPLEVTEDNLKSAVNA